MSEVQKPSYFAIGIEVNKAVTAGIHNKTMQREDAIRRLAELLARGGTPAIAVFSKIQNGQ